MSTKVDVDVTELWREFKEHPTTELRNGLVERYLPLVKYNAERIWQRLPEGVDLVVIARPGAPELGLEEVRAEWRSVARLLKARAADALARKAAAAT